MSDRLHLHIRWTIRRDMQEVLAIEASSFDCPWSKADFIDRLCHRNTIGMVVEGPNSEILGFVIYELHSGHIEITNLAVRFDARRQGIGRRVMEKLTGKLSSERQCRRRITAAVRETNLTAQLFFRECGFRAVRVVRDYYDWPAREDAYLFEYRLPAAKGRPVLAA